MKKLVEKLKKVDIELSKWTRNIIFEHLMDVLEDLKEHKVLKMVLLLRNNNYIPSLLLKTLILEVNKI
ncbi:MAG: hypothetical protein ACFFA7_07350 [Promethearchaeota archaeon]